MPEQSLAESRSEVIAELRRLNLSPVPDSERAAVLEAIERAHEERAERLSDPDR